MFCKRLFLFSLLFLMSAFGLQSLAYTADEQSSSSETPFENNSVRQTANGTPSNPCKLNAEVTKSWDEKTIRPAINQAETDHQIRLSSQDSTASNCKNTADTYKKQIEKIETCNEKRTELVSAIRKFGGNCKKFSGSNLRCFKAVDACAQCPDSDEDSSEEYNCVKIHKKTSCPALSGKELKTAKERGEQVTEERKELEENIKGQEKDLMDMKNDLTNQLADLESEFIEARRRLERKTEEQKTELEMNLKKNKAQISKAVSESLAAVQEKINNSLKIAHSFENAISKVNREYRQEKRRIIMECEAQARGRLAEYRKRRRSAIKSGSYKIPLSSLLNKGRSHFASKDTGKLNRYYSQCLNKRKPDFKELSKIHKEKMRMIEQQREQYQADLQNSQRQIAAMNAQATKQQNSLVQEYSSNMNKILNAHKKEFQAALASYSKAKNSIMSQSNKITVGEQHLTHSKLKHAEKSQELVRERVLMSYLKKQGVEEDSEEKFIEAAEAMEVLGEAYAIAYRQCECSQDKPSPARCTGIDSKLKNAFGAGKNSDDGNSMINEFIDGLR